MDFGIGYLSNQFSAITYKEPSDQVFDAEFTTPGALERHACEERYRVERARVKSAEIEAEIAKEVEIEVINSFPRGAAILGSLHSKFNEEPRVVRIITSYDHMSIDEIIKKIQLGPGYRSTYTLITQTVTVLNISKYSDTVSLLFEFFKNIKEVTVRNELAFNLTAFDFIGLANVKPDSIQSLSLEGCINVSSSVFDHIKPLTNLTSLNLNGCRDIIKMGFDKLAATLAEFPALTSLHLSHCTDDGLAELVKTLKSLQSLHLKWCSKITDSGLTHLSNLESLRFLSLSRCNVTDACLTNLARNLKDLESLSLEGCKLAGGLHQLQNLPNLKSLGLSLGTPIDFDCLKGFKNLESLDLSENTITNRQLVELVKDLPNLQDLNVMYCEELTMEGIDKARKINPSLLIRTHL